MEGNPDQPFDPQSPRRFAYRSVKAEDEQAHPMRRATDEPQTFEEVSGELGTKTHLQRFHMYLKTE